MAARRDAMSGIEDHAAELAALWPALAMALARDTNMAETPVTAQWAAAAVVNADVLAAMITLTHDVPLTARYACETLGEPWQPRSLLTCLRAFPRWAGRMHGLGLATAEKEITWAVQDWLRLTKRALGLRKPDIPIGYACPWADSRPENHAGGRMLLCAGDEGFLRPGVDGFCVEWVVSGQIYCPDASCGASWSQGQWPLLGRMLRAATISA